MDRVLIAHDGSPASDEACRLVASLPLPDGSAVRIVTAIPSTADLRRAYGPLATAGLDVESDLTGSVAASLDAAQRIVESPGITCDTHVVRGRAADAIADEAAAWDATLVVAGSRGRGALAATVLGSVSEEIADTAPAPVLVARTHPIRTVVLGTDGSACATRAAAVLASLPLDPGVVVHVVTVIDVMWPIAVGITPTLYGEAMAFHTELEEQTREEAGRTSGEVASRLRLAGFKAESHVVSGNPGWELVAAAEKLGADLVVVGSRGLTGVRRLVLGSVARRVVRHAHCSVLVVRDRG